MKKFTLFIDLDGTVLDVSNRLYRIYANLLKELQMTPMYSKEQYMALKRKGLSEDAIIKKQTSGFISRRYMARRQALVETPEYLSYDLVNKGVREFFEAIIDSHNIVLVTRRKNKDILAQQLENLDLLKYFADIVICQEELKEDSIRKSKCFIPDNSIVVGDTEDDVVAGNNLGLPTLALTSGLRDEQFLRSYKPSAVLKSFSDLLGYRKLFKINIK